MSRTTGVDVVALAGPRGAAMIGDLGSVVGVAIGVVFFGVAALVVVKRLFHIAATRFSFSGGSSTVDGRRRLPDRQGRAPCARRSSSGSTGWTSRT